MNLKKKLAKLFPDSILASECDIEQGTNFSGVNDDKVPDAKGMTPKDKRDAQFGGGNFAGKTGDPFVDDPFFNPWAPGGSFNE